MLALYLSQSQDKYMQTTAAEDRVLAVLRADGMIPFNEIKDATTLNALAGLSKKGLARFARFSKTNCGYVLRGHSFLDDASEGVR